MSASLVRGGWVRSDDPTRVLTVGWGGVVGPAAEEPRSSEWPSVSFLEPAPFPPNLTSVQRSTVYKALLQPLLIQPPSAQQRTGVLITVSSHLGSNAQGLVAEPGPPGRSPGPKSHAPSRHHSWAAQQGEGLGPFHRCASPRLRLGESGGSAQACLI